MGKPVSSALEVKQLTAPANPAASAQLLYPKSDGYWYTKTSAGVETRISVSTTTVTTDTAQTISGVKTFSSVPLVTLPSGVTSLTSTQLTGASMRVWHDRIRFMAPTYETSPDGVTWTTQAAGSGRGVFTGRSDQGVSIDHTARWVRWTWFDNGLSYSQIQRALVKFGYVNPSPSVVTTMSSSADGVTWTQRGRETITGASAAAFAFNLTDPSSHPWYRVEMEVVGGGTTGTVARPVGIELQTARFGDQGSGPEREWPFTWTYDKQVTFQGTVNGITKSMVGLSAVDNTSDAAKPISTATQTALNGKAAVSHTHAASEVASGILDIARLPVAPSGTSNTTQVVRADDSRLSDPRPPSGTAGGDLTGTYPNPTVAALAITDAKVATANKDGVAGTPSLRTLGTGAQQALAGDTRLDQIAAPTAAVPLNNQRITGLGTPTASTDAATKAYVDAVGPGPYAKIYSTATQMIQDTSVTKMILPDLEEESTGTFGDTVNSELVIPEAGVYYIEAMCGFVGNTIGARLCRILKNSVVTRTDRIPATSASLQVFPTVATMIRCLAGDVIMAQCQQTSTAQLSTIGGENNNYLLAMWLRP